WIVHLISRQEPEIRWDEFDRHELTSAHFVRNRWLALFVCDHSLKRRHLRIASELRTGSISVERIQLECLKIHARQCECAVLCPHRKSYRTSRAVDVFDRAEYAFLARLRHPKRAVDRAKVSHRVGLVDLLAGRRRIGPLA